MLTSSCFCTVRTDESDRNSPIRQRNEISFGESQPRDSEQCESARLRINENTLMKYMKCYAKVP